MYDQKEEDIFTIMCIWVDDGIICSTSSFQLDDIVTYLNQHFEITFRQVDSFVGIQIKCNRPNRTIHSLDGD